MYRNNNMTMKKVYISPDMVIHCYGVPYSILDGSKTDKAIKVQNVEVHDYQQGFGTPGGDDFVGIDFD